MSKKPAIRKDAEDANALKGQATAADGSQSDIQLTPRHEVDTGKKARKKLKRKVSTGDATADPDDAAAAEAAGAPQIESGNTPGALAIDAPTQSADFGDGKGPSDDQQARPKQARRR